MAKQDLSVVSYILGIISIVLAFFQPFAGLIFGIIGVVQSKKQKTELSKKAKKLSTIGIVLSVIVLIFTIAATIYFTTIGINTLPSFP